MANVQSLSESSAEEALSCRRRAMSNQIAVRVSFVSLAAHPTSLFAKHKSMFRYTCPASVRASDHS